MLTAASLEAGQALRYGHLLTSTDPIPSLLPSDSGLCICLVGRLEEYNVHRNIATVYRSASAGTVAIDTSLLGVFDYRIGSWYKWYGEFAANQVVIRARILWCVDGLDLTLYDRSVQLRNKLLLSSSAQS